MKICGANSAAEADIVDISHQRAESGLENRVEPPAKDVASAPGIAATRSKTQDRAWWHSSGLAEQTAALHRQFLEGQEKTQQTF